MDHHVFSSYEDYEYTMRSDSCQSSGPSDSGGKKLNSQLVLFIRVDSPS